MPKKTKKEKIIAEYRRKLQSTVVNQNQRKSDVPINNVRQITRLSPVPVYKLDANEQKESPTTIINGTTTLSDIAATRYDLAKTLALAGIAIITELLLYWKIGR